MKGLKDKNGKFKRNLKDKTCLICKKTFRPRSEKQKSCSWKCRSGLLSISFNKRKPRYCEYCKNEFGLLKNSNWKYCSKECYTIDMIGKKLFNRRW